MRTGSAVTTTPTPSTVTSSTTQSPGRMRRARRRTNERRRGSEIQLAVTRKPLIAKKTATAISPNSGPPKRRNGSSWSVRL